MTFKFNDGGRAAAGFKGKAVDCVCRAIAIATGKPYAEVYSELSALRWNTWRAYWRDPADGLYIPGEEFKELYRWLDGADFLIVKADRLEPLVVVPLRLAAEIAVTAEKNR
jgi:hypothetical protein